MNLEGGKRKISVIYHSLIKGTAKRDIGLEATGVGGGSGGCIGENITYSLLDNPFSFFRSVCR